VTFRTNIRDGVKDREADISSDRLFRLAAAGRISSEHHHALGEYARFLVISLSSVLEEFQVQRTRSQLRHELMDLLRDILIDEIARRENITVSDEEVEAEIGRLAERMKRPREAVRQAMEKEGEIGAVRARIREDRTLDLLKANARIDTE
jgi:hypothetical protein